ncbi:MAG: 23S rRNA (adenine(1618)-N(6))-methyltransferase RlmF [Opitutaceae bacterium]|nr:23S rRNA (adenine(1618)-N(6))-methyltransferase RlmF [Opitutaceae bacterium]
MPRPAARRPSAPLAIAEGLHPRNPHRARYDFPALVSACPELARHLIDHPVEGRTLNFADPAAVLALNRALLRHHYQITDYPLPPGALCPPIPGRADYLHHLADLLSGDGVPPRGPATRLLDIGTGANVIYPLLGARAFEWSFVATDIAPASLESARRIVAANGLENRIELRAQTDARVVFAGVTTAPERFAASLCNPPFHASAAEAAAGTDRKLRNLAAGRSHRAAGQPRLNFGGRDHELWCEGGEPGFLRRMIAESAAHPQLCRWFTTLVSKSAHLPELESALAAARPAEVRIIPMRHGQKHSRILAWRFAG